MDKSLARCRRQLCIENSSSYQEAVGEEERERGHGANLSKRQKQEKTIPWLWLVGIQKEAVKSRPRRTDFDSDFSPLEAVQSGAMADSIDDRRASLALC